MSLRLKTILGVGLIEAVLLIILISTVLNYMRLASEKGLETYVETTSQLFVTTTQDAILSFDLASLESFVEEILKNNSVLYARILDSDNNLLMEGGKGDAIKQVFSLDTRYQDVNDGVYDIEKAVTVSDINYGLIQMGFSTQQVESGVAEARRLAAIIAIVEMLLVALFSFFLGVYLTKQLKVLRNSARNIAAGDLDHNIEIKTCDEIGEVSHSFNKMIDSLNEANTKTQQYQNELEALNKSLEERVKRRTSTILEQKDKLESAYEELQKTQEQLVQSEKMASIGQLAAGVAHEINNPVAFIKSNLSSLENYLSIYKALIDKQQMVLDDAKHSGSDELKEKCADIESYKQENDIDFMNEDIVLLLEDSKEGTHRVSEIVQGLKVYARAPDEVRQEFDVNECLNDTLRMLNNELKYHCEVVTEFEDLPLLAGNKSKLAQVFTNLLMNAIQAMDKAGKLTLNTLLLDSGLSPSIQVVISDTGKGIAQENLSKLFDPFFTTKPVGEGTGLGLSISQGIINDHGGTITVASELDKGTSFSIVLPLQP